jgi:hypothetical protein
LQQPTKKRNNEKHCQSTQNRDEEESSCTYMEFVLQSLVSRIMIIITVTIRNKSKGEVVLVAD